MPVARTAVRPKGLSREAVEELSAKEPSWLRKLRLNAWERFSSAELPRLQYGMGIRTDLSGLQLDSLPLETVRDADALRDIRVPDGIELLPLRKAVQRDDVKQHLFSLLRPEGAFPALLAATWSDGIFIRIKKDATVKEALEFTLPPSGSHHVLVLAEPNSSATIIETSGQGQGGICLQGVEVICGEGSHVQYAAIQTLDSETWNISQRRARVLASARMDWMDFCLGSKLTLNTISSDLAGQGAQGYVWGLFYGNGRQHFDLHSDTVHNAPDTVCDMRTKGALSGRARAIYHGLVKIDKNAPRSNGYQKEETLLLSKHAHADSIPKLEIDNNDVRCTHGATLGQIDQEKVFYLMSRGLPREVAVKRVVEGFFEPLVLRIEIEQVRQRLRELIDRKIAVRE